MFKNFKNRYSLLLLAIVLFGLFLRTYRISQNTMYGDELTLVYDSYSLLKTGHDQVGKLLPLTFTMGVGRPAGYVYGSIPFVALFGPSSLGVRMLSILSGSGLIILMYFLGKKLFSKEIGLVSAFFVSASPWDLSLSRGGFEANFALFLAVLGIVAFLYASEKPKLYMLSAISWGLTLNTYPTYKVTLPLMLILLVTFSGGIKILLQGNKFFKYALVVGFFFSLIAYSQTFLSNSEERFLSVNVFSQREIKEKIIEEINTERSLDATHVLTQLIFHNKMEKYFTLLRDGYIKNLSANFLFLQGDGNPRHNMGETGELFFVEILLIFFGIIYLANRSNKDFKFIFFWILLTPIASVLLLEEHALRNSFMLPPLIILSSLGFIYLIKKTSYIIVVFLILVWLIQFTFIAERIYFLSPNKFARFWSYPAYQAANLAIENKDKYDYIFLSDEIDNVEYAYQSYGKIDPNLVIAQNKERSTVSSLRFKKLGNVYIGTFPEEIEAFASNLKGTKLFIKTYSESDLGEVMVSKDNTHSLIVKSYK